MTRGLILSGGMGTRLKPLTEVTHKHLLPVYNKVMIEFPLTTLTSAGIEEIIVITGERNAGQYVDFLGDGSRYGCSIHYGFQPEAGGIAQAIKIAEPFCGDSNIAVILGDNYFEDDLSADIKEHGKREKGAGVFFKEMSDPTRYGVPKFEGDKVLEIIEKPKNPPSNFALTGLYLFDKRVFDFIETIEPSERGELEVADVVNIYAKEGSLSHRFIDGEWFDMGTFDSLLEASNYMKSRQQGQL